MADAATLQQRLEALRDARARGISRITVQTPLGRRETEYRTDAEMAAAIADIERQLAVAQGQRVGTVYFQTSKGL